MARASAHTRHADGHISGRKRQASVSLAMPSRRCEAYSSVLVLHARVRSRSSCRKVVDELNDIAIRVSSLSQALGASGQTWRDTRLSNAARHRR
eukprot:77674-Pyramimonas_sp.AAC.1